MSERAVKLIQYTKGLTLAEYGVFVMIALYADSVNWRCRRSLTQVAFSSNLHRATAVRAVQRLLDPYAADEARPLVYVRNGDSDSTKVNTYELNIELLRELKKQSTKIRQKTLHTESAANTKTKVKSNPLRKSGDYAGVLATPLSRGVKSDFGGPKRDKVPTARSEAKKFVREMQETMAQLTDEALSKLADQIAVMHPLNRLKDLTVDDVSKSERSAILTAMGEEAIFRHMNKAVAGRAMLSGLLEWDGIPRSEWHLLVDVPNFYAKRHHRLQPRELIRTLQETKGQRGLIGESSVETEPPLSSIFPRRREVATSRQSIISRMVAMRRSQAPKEKNLFR